MAADKRNAEIKEKGTQLRRERSGASTKTGTHLGMSQRRRTKSEWKEAVKTMEMV